MPEDDGFLDAAEAARRMVERSTYGVERFPTGYDAFDLEYGAIGRGELGILSARASVGKSTFILNCLARTPQVSTVVFSLEMEPELQSLYLACMSHELMCPFKSAGDTFAGEDNAWRKELVAAMESISELYPRLSFCWPGVLSIAEMRDYCRLALNHWGEVPKRVYVDHLGLMPGGEAREDYVHNLRALKEWAVHDSIAVIVVQQQNRSGQGDSGANHGHLPPGLASGMLGGEEVADFGWGLYQPGMNPALKDVEAASMHNVTRLNVWKNRVFSQKSREGVDLRFDHHSHRLTPPGETPFILSKG
jgi:hypothetical protein